MSSRRKDWKNSKSQKQKGKAAADPVLTFAQNVRYHKEFESRWAVLRDTRVEFFRGKDLTTLLSKHSEITEPLTSANITVDPPVAETVAEMMLRRRLVVRCDRVNKTLRPGKKKLSRWPAKLELHPAQMFTEDDGFYAWTFESKRSFWQTFLSFLLPIFTVACCLFPVFPYWAKLGVLYMSMSLLFLMLGTLLVRFLVFGAIWIVSGKSYWFLPNILADEVASLSELFRFFPDKDEDPPAKLLTRLVVTAVTGGLIYLSVQNAPDEDARASYRKKVGNIIDEVIAWSPAMLAANVTAVLNSTGSGSVPVNETVPKLEVNETAKIEEIFAKAANLASDLGEEVLDLEVETEEEERDTSGRKSKEEL